MNFLAWAASRFGRQAPAAQPLVVSSIASVEVRPRAVALPWEREAFFGHRRTRVDAEDGLQPEPGPLHEYQAIFPDRYVVWNRKRQLWEIRQLNRATGLDERYEFLFFFEAPPDPITGKPRTEDELALMIEERSPELLQVYRPFDHHFVRERLRQRAEYLENPATYSTRVAARNRARMVSRIREKKNNAAAQLNEVKRLLPTLAGEDRVPLVGVGIDLTSPLPLQRAI